MFSFPGILISDFFHVFGTVLRPLEVRSNSPVQVFQCLGKIIFFKVYYLGSYLIRQLEEGTVSVTEC